MTVTVTENIETIDLAPVLNATEATLVPQEGDTFEVDQENPADGELVV